MESNKQMRKYGNKNNNNDKHSKDKRISLFKYRGKTTIKHYGTKGVKKAVTCSDPERHQENLTALSC